MPDNSTTPPNGIPVASDDIGGFQFQRVKLVHGADGVNAGDVAVANPLPVSALGEGLISTVNSSAVALGISAVFTGTAEDVTEYNDARVYVFSDQASATDGLSIQQSSNGTNWDAADAYSIPATTGRVFGIGLAARFFRIVYTNGVTAQTAFRLQVKLHKSYSKGSSNRPQDGRANDNDFEEVSGHLMGYNGTSWDRLRASIANGLGVDVTRVQATVNVAGTRNNNGSANVTGSFHLTIGGSDGTNLRPLSMDTTGRPNNNTAQINGVTPLMGNGIAGTGSQRVSISSDNTAFAVNSTLSAETTKVIGTVNVAAAQTLATVTAVTAITNALPTGANTIGAVTGPAAAALALNATLTDHTQRLQASTLAVTVTAAANTAATATLPAVAANFHYITGIEIMRTSTAALAGTATLVVTTSNLPGALAWSFGNAMAAGATQRDVAITFANPIKSSTVNTATTVVMPAPGAAVLWRANVYYYTAP